MGETAEIIRATAFVVLVGAAFWIVVVAWTWLPIGPTRDEVEAVSNDLSKLRSESSIRHKLAYLLNAHRIHPVRTLLCSVLLLLLSLQVVK